MENGRYLVEPTQIEHNNWEIIFQYFQCMITMIPQCNWMDVSKANSKCHFLVQSQTNLYAGFEA